MKEAEWHIDFALMVANNADWSGDVIEKKYVRTMDYTKFGKKPESYKREMYK